MRRLPTAVKKVKKKENGRDQVFTSRFRTFYLAFTSPGISHMLFSLLDIERREKEKKKERKEMG